MKSQPEPKSKLVPKKSAEPLFPPRPIRLTEREREILSLYVAGSSYQEAGDTLGISAKTVAAYLQRVREKLRAKSRVDLMDFAIREKLLPGK